MTSARSLSHGAGPKKISEPDLMANPIDSLERFQVRFIRYDDTVGEQHYSTLGAAKAGQVKLAAVGINSHLYERDGKGWVRVEG